MADEEVSSEIFDPSLKKKKKKKTGFNLDAALSEPAAEVSEPAPENGEAEDRENKEDTPDMDDMFGKKTKKKKKKPFNFEEMNDALPDKIHQTWMICLVKRPRKRKRSLLILKK